MFTIYHNVPIEASKEVVFNAVSNPAELENWWPLKCSGTPSLNSEYNFFFDEPYDWYGKVSEYKNNKSFHVKMTKSDDDWNPTTFGFDLEEKDGITWLQFFHKDWQQANNEFRHSSFCWALLLNALKNYIEQGTIIPFENRS